MTDSAIYSYTRVSLPGGNNAACTSRTTELQQLPWAASVACIGEVSVERDVLLLHMNDCYMLGI